MHITLFVPELLWPEPEERDTQDSAVCPALLALVAHAEIGRSSRRSLEATIGDALGFSARPAFADWRRRGESVSAGDDGPWLCCDPVHLALHQDRLILADATRLAIGEDEAHALTGALNAEFAEDRNLGRFFAASPSRWYLAGAADYGVFAQTPPLSQVAGRSVGMLLSSDALPQDWRRAGNAIQMLLHAHPVNRRREDEGRMTINALWFWGGAAASPDTAAPPAPVFDRLWADDPLALGAARSAGIATDLLPETAAGMLATAAGKSHAIVLDALADPVRYEDGAAYRQQLEGLERHWFAPLSAALKSGRISTLTLCAPTVYGTVELTVRKSDRWKFWRRATPLSQLAGQLSKENP